MKNLRMKLTGREVSKANNLKQLSERGSTKVQVNPRIGSSTARLPLVYGSMKSHIWKYAACLVMLLTLGVGQMWATYYYRGNQNSWGATAMTASDDGFYEYFSAKGYSNNGNQNNNFKVSTSTSSWDYNNGYYTKGYNSTDITDAGNWDSDNICVYNAADFYILVYKPSTAINATSNPVVCFSTYLPSGVPRFLVGENWTDASWSNTAAANQMTYNTSSSSYSKDISISDASKEIALKITARGDWSTTVYDAGEKGTGHNLSQALGGADGNNLTFKVSHAGTTIITLTSAGQINVDAPYQVSYAAGTGATGSVSASAITTYGATCTLSSSTFSKTGYTQDGWATSDGGDKAYNLGGTYTGGYSDVTLYPHWKANTTTITLNLNGGTSGATSVTATYDAALPSFTLATRTGSYNLTGYWTESSGGTKVINADGTFAANSGIWNRTDGPTLTLYAQWSSFLTVTYDGNGNTGGTAPTDANEYSSGATVTVKAKPDGLVKTGYTFTGWKAGGVTYTAGQTFTITANTTLVAQWSENKYTVTISGGTASSTTAGISTTGTATVSLPAGKKFTGWTLGSGVTLVSGTTSSATITFQASQASSVTAGFADRAGVKMYFAKPTTLDWGTLYAYAWKNGDASVQNAAYPGVELATTEVVNNIVYYVYQYYTEADGIGGGATGNSAWNRIIFGCNIDAKKTGDLTIADGHYYYTNSTTTGSESAVEHAWYIKGTMNEWGEDNPITHDRSINEGTVFINLTKGTTYEFKVYDQLGALMWSNSSALGGITNSVSATTLYKDDANVMKITPDKTGSYKFTISNTNTTTPKVAVQYPSQYLVGSWDSWDEDDNVFDQYGYLSLNLAAGSYQFKVLYNGDWYGLNSANYTESIKDYVLYDDQGNMTITVAKAGDYVFGWNGADKMLSIVFPDDQAKAQLPENGYIYFDSRGLSAATGGWNNYTFSTRFWLKNYASGLDYSHVDCNRSNVLEDSIFYALIPAGGKVGQVQLNRMKTDFTEFWNYSNKTYAIDRPDAYANCLVKEDGHEGWSNTWTPQWTTYCPPMSSVTLADNSTTTWGGNGTSGTPYLVPTGGDIKVHVTASTSALNDPNMTKYFLFKKAGAAVGAGSATTSKTITASSTTGTKEAVTVEAYNYYNSTEGTHLTSSAIYYEARTPYSVTHTLVGATASAGATGAGATVYGAVYNATFAASTGYDLPTAVTVTIGGTPATLTTDYTWNSSTGVLQIMANKITGNVVITVHGAAQTLTFAPASGTAWNNSANWSPACVPTIEHDVVIQKPVEVNITDARAKSVVIDQYSGSTGQLVIPAGQELVIAETLRKKNAEGSIVATEENDVIINSDASNGLGALVMGTHDGTNQATVNFYTLAHGAKDSKASVSQYVGTPFGNRPKMLNQFYHSWMYKFVYPDGVGNVGWQRIGGDDELEAFRGYCVISADPAGHSYWMQGALVAAEDKAFNDLKCNITGSEGNILANNEHMFANSWMAPIKIKAFNASDFGDHTTATIYIFNSGSPDDYDSGKTSAGQYVAYPVNTASETDVIPAMQAFSVYTYGSTGDAASLTLDYSRLVYDPAVATGADHAAITPNKAPRRGKVQLDNTEKMHVYVSAKSGYKDMVYMLAHEDFSENFENGWDGTKIFGESAAPQLYAQAADGKMAVNCVPTWEGTVLGFRKGADESIFTFTFDYAGEGEWYLNDLKEQYSTFISPENTYTFVASEGDSEARFIISHTPIQYVPTGVDEQSAISNQQSAVRKLIIDEQVYIIRNGRMYDMTGEMVR